MGQPKYRIPHPHMRKRPSVDLMKTVRLRATLLTTAELDEIMKPIRLCAARLREGVATKVQFEVLHTVASMALVIEQRGHLRGMHEHINTAQVALSAIFDRACENGDWRAVELHWNEIDAIDTVVDLYELQLQQLSAAELARFTRTLIGQTLSRGGSAASVQPADIGLEGCR
jgi:hypothetical protein